MHLFTYGTLMFPEVWQAVVGKHFETSPAQLPGYEIFRVAGALYPGIITANSSPSGRGQVREQLSPPSWRGERAKAVATESDSGPPTSDLHTPPSSVPGLVYLDVDPESLVRLDAFEGHEYIRRSVTVFCNDGTSAGGRELTADTYIVPTDSAHILTPEPWTAADFLAHGHLAEFLARYSGFNRLDVS
jgi:gamma-glutamylcyclotransferase (GGCT)/AIG2-like uncharacterized protein YtfP